MVISKSFVPIQLSSAVEIAGLEKWYLRGFLEVSGWYLRAPSAVTSTLPPRYVDTYGQYI
jgi:hypothetical protein